MALIKCPELHPTPVKATILLLASTISRRALILSVILFTSIF